MKGTIIFCVILICVTALAWRLTDCWTVVAAGPGVAFKINRMTGETRLLDTRSERDSPLRQVP
jgi:hypothetical protein